MKPRRLLVAVDESGHSMNTLNYLSRILPQTHSNLKLFHVMNPYPEPFWDMAHNPEGGPDNRQAKAYQQLKSTKIQSVLEQMQALLVNAGFKKNSVSIVIQNRQRGVARDIAIEAPKRI